MYTKEKLESENFIRLYKFFGKKSLEKLTKVEEIISERKINEDIEKHNQSEALKIQGNTISYSKTVQLNKGGTYLNYSVSKEKNNNLLDISLQLGIKGFDITTGERYDRTQAKVLYTYENDDVTINQIKDEAHYNSLEERHNIKINEKVLKLKK